MKNGQLHEAVPAHPTERSGVGVGANRVATKVCQWHTGEEGGPEATAGPTEKCICAMGERP